MKINIFLGLSLLLSVFLYAHNDGELDTSFNNSGYVSIPYSNVSGVYPKFVKELSNGSYLVGVTTTSNNKTKESFLTKFLHDGSLDLSFGVNGRLLFSTNNDEDGSYSINAFHSILDINSQEYLIVGTIEDIPTFFKVDQLGNIINSYGNQGFQNINEGKIGRHNTILSNGKIVSASTFKIDSLDIFRNNFSIYNSNGGIDLSFGNNGSKILDITNQNIDMFSKILDYKNNSFIAVGNSMPYITYDTGFIARFDYDGNFDTSFGQNGKVILDYNVLGEYNTLRDAVVQNDDKIIICGRSLFEDGTGGGNYYASVPMLARFNSDGSLDHTFGNNGFVMVNTTLFGANEDYTRLALLPNNKILVLGHSSLPFPFMKTAVILRRFNADGSPDISFGTNSYFYYTYNDNANLSESNTGLELEILGNQKVAFVGRHYRSGVPWEGTMFRLNINLLSNENFTKNNFNFFPNPVKDVLHIDSKIEIDRALIFDKTGQLIKEINDIDNSFISLQDLSSGLYIVQIITNNSFVNRFKIIKE